ncbi:MAG: radical SAM protein, partial [Candidatus Poribacteria bacterium]
MRVVLVIPPVIQPNTPYPSITYLAGFLRGQGIDVSIVDASLDLLLKLFSAGGLQRVTSWLSGESLSSPLSVRNFLKRADEYINTIDAVIRFLQGNDPTLAFKITGRNFLPEGERIRTIEREFTKNGGNVFSLAFGAMGTTDMAKYLASLYLDDIADVVQEGIDGRFGFSRYGEKLTLSLDGFGQLHEALSARPTLIDTMIDENTRKTISEHEPELVGISVPFPGNVYGAFRMAQLIKSLSPSAKLVLGGGFVNTELRQLSDPRVFDYFDFITFDDGETPLLRLIDHLDGRLELNSLVRTMMKKDDKIMTIGFSNDSIDITRKNIAAPSYKGLKLDEYFSVFETLNPALRIWSDCRWNKLTLA